MSGPRRCFRPWRYATRLGKGDRRQDQVLAGEQQYALARLRFDETGLAGAGDCDPPAVGAEVGVAHVAECERDRRPLSASESRAS